MTDRIPSNLGHFSELVAVGSPGEWICISGTLGFEGSGTTIVPGGTAAEAEAIFDRMESLLEARGGSLTNIVKLTIYLTDLEQYGDFSKVRTRRFAEKPPASAAVGVAALLAGATVEVEAVAFIVSTAESA